MAWNTIFIIYQLILYEAKEMHNILTALMESSLRKNIVTIA